MSPSRDPARAVKTDDGSGGFFYRVGQFLRGFVARVEPAEYALVAELLSPPALPLFLRMPVDAQRHSLDVLYDVQGAGFHDRDLAAAALLHDAGKVAPVANDEELDIAAPEVLARATRGATLGLWWRGPLVLLERIAPDLLMRWACSGSGTPGHGTPGHGTPGHGTPGHRASGRWAGGLRYLLYLYLYHPHIGAAAARAAGCSPMTCRLIDRHQDRAALGRVESPEAARFVELLGVLQWADDRN